MRLQHTRFTFRNKDINTYLIPQKFYPPLPLVFCCCCFLSLFDHVLSIFVSVHSSLHLLLLPSSSSSGWKPIENRVLTLLTAGGFKLPQQPQQHDGRLQIRPAAWCCYLTFLPTRQHNPATTGRAGTDNPLLTRERGKVLTPQPTGARIEREIQRQRARRTQENPGPQPTDEQAGNNTTPSIGHN